MKSAFLSKTRKEKSKSLEIEISRDHLKDQIEALLIQLRHINLDQRITDIEFTDLNTDLLKLKVFYKKEVTKKT